MNPGQTVPDGNEPPSEAVRLTMSSLGDGQLAATETRDAVSTWASSREARAAWRDYQVIGDVLRSDELAGRSDEAGFLAALRVRMAAEPVVMVPATVTSVVTPARTTSAVNQSAQRRSRVRWMNSAAVAAGFAAVAGVLVALNPDWTGNSDASLLSRVDPAPSQTTRTGSAPVVAPSFPQTVTAETSLGPMVRDSRVDAYLNAHRQLGVGAGWVTQAGFVRPASVEGAAR